MNARQVIGMPLTQLPGAQRRRSIEDLFGNAVQVYEFRGVGMTRRLWLVVTAGVVTSAHWQVRDLVADLRATASLR